MRRICDNAFMQSRLIVATWAALAALFTFLSLARASVDTSTCTRDALETTRKQMDANSFDVGGTTADYAKDFGPSFTMSLASLNANQRWIDMGAGRARAQLEYLAKSNSPAYTLAVGVKRPHLDATDVALEKRVANLGNRFKYLEGRFLENIDDAELGKADLITDSEGVLMYTTRASDAINMYLRVLSMNGSIWIHAPGVDAARPAAIMVRAHDQKLEPLYAWLARQPGLRVSTTSWADAAHTIPVSFKVSKTAPDAQVPGLSFESADCAHPTLRTFREL